MDYPGHNYNPNNYDHNYDQPLNYNETSTIGNEVVTLFQVFLEIQELQRDSCNHSSLQARATEIMDENKKIDFNKLKYDSKYPF